MRNSISKERKIKNKNETLSLFIFCWQEKYVMIMFDAPVPTSTANSVARWQAKVEVEHDAPFFLNAQNAT